MGCEYALEKPLFFLAYGEAVRYQSIEGIKVRIQSRHCGFDRFEDGSVAGATPKICEQCDQAFDFASNSARLFDVLYRGRNRQQSRCRGNNPLSLAGQLQRCQG